MTDIRIVVTRENAYLFAETERGKNWLKRNMSEYHPTFEYTKVSREGIEETIQLMLKDDIIVEHPL